MIDILLRRLTDGGAKDGVVITEAQGAKLQELIWINRVSCERLLLGPHERASGGRMPKAHRWAMDESRLLHLNAARARQGAISARDEWTSMQLTQLAHHYEREARRMNLMELAVSPRARTG